MDIRTAPRTGRAWAWAILVMALPALAETTQPPASRLAFPLAGLEHALRDNFHEKRGMRPHHALDIMAPRGTPVRAVDDGRIAKLYRGPLAGIAIYQFNAANTRVYFYAHLDRYAPGLKEGARVELGDDKRWWKGKAVNPSGLLRPAPGEQARR